MQILTAWFERNIFLARMIIALAHVVFTLIALQLAGWLQELPVFIPLWFFLIPVVVVIVVALLAHFTKIRLALSVRTSAGYALVRVKYAMVLMASYLLVVGWFYNNVHLQLSPATTLQGIYAPPLAMSKKADDNSEKKKVSFFKKQKEKLSLRELRKVLKEAKMLRKEGGDPATAQAFAIIGIIILALFLSYLVLAASCSLSCSGVGTGAILVGVGGMALIIWGTIAWITHVNKGTRKKLDAQEKKAKPAASAVSDTNSNSIQ
jgi:hypothetical protein